MQHSKQHLDPYYKNSMKFKNEGSLSDISYSKDNESEEELVTEEMFQKVLAETKLEMNAKKRKPKFKVTKSTFSYYCSQFLNKRLAFLIILDL